MSMPDTLPILFIDIDGEMLRRRHLGMSDGFEYWRGIAQPRTNGWSPP
jgi:hypothetical protein